MPRAAIHLGKSGEPDKLSFAQGLKFNASYWYVVALCVTFYSGIFPFRSFATDLIHQQNPVAKCTSRLLLTATFASAHRLAGSLNSLLPFSAMIATPLFGLSPTRLADERP